MSFFRREAWFCTFLETDLCTPIGRIRTFMNDSKLRELIDRTPTRLTLADRQALEQAIETGRGGLFLEINFEQYTRLKSAH